MNNTATSNTNRASEEKATRIRTSLIMLDLMHRLHDCFHHVVTGVGMTKLGKHKLGRVQEAKDIQAEIDSYRLKKR
jgi:hypothetical protein